MQIVRNAVKQNMLSDLALVADKDRKTYIIVHGKGLVCVTENIAVGFAIADLKEIIYRLCL